MKKFIFLSISLLFISINLSAQVQTPTPTTVPVTATPAPTTVPTGTDIGNGFRCNNGTVILNGNKLTSKVAIVRIDALLFNNRIKLRRAATRVSKANLQKLVISLEVTKTKIQNCGNANPSTTPTPTPVVLTAQLNGQNVVPAVISDNSGTCTVSVQKDALTAAVSCDTSILASNFIKTGLFFGVPALNGREICSIATTKPSTCNLSSQEIARLLGGDDAYLAIYTRGFGGGEVRGGVKR